MSSTMRLWLTALVCLGASVAVAATREPVTAGLWALICGLTFGFGRREPAGLPLYLWLGVVLFYPAASDRFTSINESATMIGLALCLMGALSISAWRLLARRRSWIATLLLMWVGWGLVVYLPVLIGWAWHLTGRSLPWIFNGVPVHTSALKVAIPVIAAFTPAIAVVSAIGTESDARRFFAFLLWAMTGLAALSLLQAATGGFTAHWTPVTYSMLPGRLHSISLPDPNGFARQLLFPILMLATVWVMARRAVPGWWLNITLMVAFACLALTQSRTGAISSGAGLAVVAAANFRKPRVSWLVSIVVAVAMLGALGLLVLASTSERLTLANFSTRLDLYEAVWTVSQDHLLFGVRPGGYGPALLAAGYQLIGAHNMWLAVAVEWGWPMAFMLTAAIIGTWGATLDGMMRLRTVPRSTAGWREASAMLVGASAVAVTYSVHGLTEIVPPEYVFLALGVALAARFRLVPRVRAFGRQGTATR